MEAEKRDDPRFPCVHSRECIVDLEDLQKKGFLYNFSRKGLAFHSAHRLSKNEVHHLEIHAPSFVRPIACDVRIVWAHHDSAKQTCAYGARILHMDPALKTELLDVFYQDWKRIVIAQSQP